MNEPSLESIVGKLYDLSSGDGQRFQSDNLKKAIQLLLSGEKMPTELAFMLFRLSLRNNLSIEEFRELIKATFQGFTYSEL